MKKFIFSLFFVFLFSGFVIANPVDLLDNLVSYYSFDDFNLSSPYYLDLHSINHFTNFTNESTFIYPNSSGTSKLGNSFYYPNQSFSHVFHSYPNLTFSSNGSFSFSFWYNYTILESSFGDNRSIALPIFSLGSYQDSSNDFDNTIMVRFEFLDSSGCEEQGSCSEGIFPTFSDSVVGDQWPTCAPIIVRWDEWNHIVITYSNSEFNIYHNSELCDSSSYPFDFSTGSIFSVGNSHNQHPSTPHTPFYLDELSIYDSSLSPLHVSYLYNCGAGFQYPFNSSLGDCFLPQSPFDVISSGGSLGDFLNAWNPSVYELLVDQFYLTFSGSNLEDFFANSFELLRLFVLYVLRSPASLTPSGGLT